MSARYRFVITFYVSALAISLSNGVPVRLTNQVVTFKGLQMTIKKQDKSGMTRESVTNGKRKSLRATANFQDKTIDSSFSSYFKANVMRA